MAAGELTRRSQLRISNLLRTTFLDDAELRHALQFSARWVPSVEMEGVSPTTTLVCGVVRLDSSVVLEDARIDARSSDADLDTSASAGNAPRPAAA